MLSYGFTSLYRLYFRFWGFFESSHTKLLPFANNSLVSLICCQLKKHISIKWERNTRWNNHYTKKKIVSENFCEWIENHKIRIKLFALTIYSVIQAFFFVISWYSSSMLLWRDIFLVFENYLFVIFFSFFSWKRSLTKYISFSFSDSWLKVRYPCCSTKLSNQNSAKIYLQLIYIRRKYYLINEI